MRVRIAALAILMVAGCATSPRTPPPPPITRVGFDSGVHADRVSACALNALGGDYRMRRTAPWLYQIFRPQTPGGGDMGWYIFNDGNGGSKIRYPDSFQGSEEEAQVRQCAGMAPNAAS